MSYWRQVRPVFHQSDQGSKGYLNPDDLKHAMIVLFGYKPSKYEVGRLMAPCCDNRMDFETFTKVMTSKLAAVDEDEDIKHIFMSFDTQYRGYITLQDLKKVAGRVAPTIKDSTLEAAFSEADRDGDGRVSHKDLEFVMKFDES